MPRDYEVQQPVAVSPKSDPKNAEPEEMDDEMVKMHFEALKRYQESWTAEDDQRDQCLDDLQFAHVEESQWDDYTRALRKDRPKYEINKVALAIEQVLGDMRQSHISGKIRAISGNASVQMAENLSGLVRNIENDSNFKYIKNIAAKEAFTGGFSAWQVVTEWNDDDSFEQSIKIKPIHSATTSVYFDQASRDYCHRDARWAFVKQDISKDEFRELYGKDTPMTSVDTEDYIRSKDWQDRDTVAIADYWVKEPYTKRIGYFSDGGTREITDDLEDVLDELAEQGITLVRERSVQSHKVMHYKMSGDMFLDGPNEWPGKFIPVVPVYGYEMWLDNQHYYRGMVRFAKDAQRIYNYTTSAKIEAAARAPQDPWMVTPRMVKGFEQQWQNFPNQNDFALPFNPDPMVPGGVPQRLGAPAVNNALVEQTYQADQDIQATTGRFAPSLGNNPREQSGRALGIQRQQTDLGTFEMFDNLESSIRYTTEIILDLIPKTYDTPRVQRILNEDGSTQLVEFNKTVYDDESGEYKVVENDVTLGKYDVISSTGPTYMTKRQETAENLAFLIQTAPELAPMALPFYLENMDSPGVQELKTMLRKQLINQGMLQPNEEEMAAIQQQQQDPAFIQQQQMQAQLQDLQLKTVEAEARSKAAEAYQKEILAQKDAQLVAVESEQALADVEKTESETAKNLATAEKALADAEYTEQQPISQFNTK
jgi:hypothetical protein